MDKLTESEQLSEPSELDETFFLESHKGLTVESVKSRKRGEKADHTGISDDLVCLTTGIERQGDSYIQAYNMGRPSSEEVRPFFEEHVTPGTYFWVDGERCFPPLFKQYNCDFNTIKSGTTPDQVNHLNTVNSLHSRIDDLYKHYRGVSTVYINRYANLFMLKQKFLGYDTQEIVLKVIGGLRKYKQFFMIKDIREKHLFDDPVVTFHRVFFRFWHGHMPKIADPDAPSRVPSMESSS